MSVRKVSDLESVSLTDGKQDPACISAALFEVSFPCNNGGYAYKSMKTQFQEIKKNILISGDMPIYAPDVDETDPLSDNAVVNMKTLKTYLNEYLPTVIGNYIAIQS